MRHVSSPGLRSLIVLSSIGALLMSTVETEAAEIKGTSRIDAVTVYPQGAEVTRLARVKLEAGEHVVVFTDLPASAAPGSIRVEGKATGRLQIGSVDTRRLLVPRTDPVQAASERRRIELEIERLNDELAIVQGTIHAAETQKALIAKLVELPTHPAPVAPGGSAASPDWGQIFALIGTRMAEAQKTIQDAQLKARDLQRRIEDQQKALAAIAPAQEERTEARINVSAGGPLEADLVIRYQVNGASWTPLYDARLSTGAKAVAPKLSLTRRAMITQRTGEEWTGVTLSLSTARPGGGTAAPTLPPLVVDFEPDAPPPPPRPMAMSDADAGLKRRSVEMAPAAMAPAPAAPAPKLAAEEVRADVQVSAFQAVFVVPGRQTIGAAGEAKRVQIDSIDLEPQLVVRTTPRIDAKAYLYAKLALPKGAPFLAGQVALFRDNTFVGNGRMPQRAGGEEHELGFGPDDAVRVKHAVLEEKRGESGIISSVKTDQRQFRITVKSLHERPIQLTITDQLPVSLNQEIKVEYIGRIQPTRQNVEDKRGVIAFDMTIAPDEEKVIDIGYKVQWPAAKRLQFRHQP